MHYYKKNIGDYHKKAGRLSMLQHGAYTLLIDSCYDRERFPTLEEAIDWCWASTDEEIAAVTFVVNKFFTEEGGVFIQNRIQEEIDRYHENSKTNKRIALEREAKKREKSTKRERIVNEAPPNQEPLTINHNNISLSTNADGGLNGSKKPSTEISEIEKRILDIYHQKLTGCSKVKMDAYPGSTKQTNLRARIKSNPEHRKIEFWEWFFENCSEVDYIQSGLGNWKGNFDYFVKKEKFTTLIERFVS